MVTSLVMTSVIYQTSTKPLEFCLFEPRTLLTHISVAMTRPKRSLTVIGDSETVKK